MNDFKNIKELNEKFSQWIKAADSKVSILFVIMSLICGFTLSIAFDKVDNICFQNILIILILILLLVVLLISLLVLCPRFFGEKKHSYDSLTAKEVSISFYNDVSKFESADSFINYYENLTQNDCENQMLKQCYHLAGIATRKMKLYKVSIILSAIIILLCTVLLISYIY